MSLMYAKESIVLSALKDIEENQKHMQDVNLQSSNVWKAKSLQMTTQLAEVLYNNSKLTSLNLQMNKISAQEAKVMAEGLKLSASVTEHGALPGLGRISPRSSNPSHEARFVPGRRGRGPTS